MRGTSLKRAATDLGRLSAALLTLAAAPPLAAGVNSWTPSLFYGGTFSLIAAAPDAPGIVYGASPDAFVFASGDGGASWKLSGSFPPGNGTPIRIEVEPGASATLFAGTEAGVFKSTDGG